MRYTTNEGKRSFSVRFALNSYCRIRDPLSDTVRLRFKALCLRRSHLSPEKTSG